MKNFTFFMIFSLVALFATGQTATFDWQETELSDGNILQKMTINGDIAVIAGFGNSFFKSIDGGATWDTLILKYPEFNYMDISIKGSVGYIVSGKEKMYDASPDVYASGVILKTTDGGATWSTIVAPTLGDNDSAAVSPSAALSFGWDFQSVEAVNDSVAFCGLRWYEYTPEKNITHAGAFKTSDGGKTWINLTGDLGNSVVTSIIFKGDAGFIGGNKLLYKATAASDSIVDIFAAMPGDGSDYISDITFGDSSEVYISTISDSIYFSFNSGATFDKFGTLKGGWDIVKVNDSTLVVAGGSNKSYASTDNGQTWSLLGITTSIWEIAGVVNDSINMLAKAKIYKCAVTDLVAGNYNWVIQELGSANLQKAYIADENNVTIVGSDGGFFKTTDAGLNWSPVDIPENPALDAMYEDIDFNGLTNNGDEAYACFNRFKFVDYPSSSDNYDIYWSGGIVYTDDNWETNKFLDIAKIGKADAADVTKNPNNASCNGVNTSVVKLLDDGSLLLWARWYDFSTGAKVEHSRVFKTTDGGKNWTVITEDFEKRYVQAIAASGDTIYIAGYQILLKSVDGGGSFADLYPILDEGEDDKMFINSIHLGNPGEVFLTTSVDSVYRTTDGGATFETLGGVKGANDFYKFDDNSWIFMGSSGKNKFTNSTGDVWQDCYPGTTIFEIGGVYGDNFYALAKGRFFTNDIDNFDLTTSIKEIKLDNELTVLYKPFAIELVSSESEIERCKVYSITGRLISDYEPNNRSYELLRSNFQPGIYVIEVLIEGKRHTKKIVF